MSSDEAKKERAAEDAVREVKSGQILGLGTGSTAKFVVIKIGERYRAGELEDIVGVPTSEATRALAEQWGIPLAPIENHPVIDLAIDGADEVDPNLDLIKGLGGALLREKAVEIKAKRFIVTVDDSKLVGKLGTKSPLPIEVAPETWERAVAALERLGCTPLLREDAAGVPKRTDQQNYLLDCRFAKGIDDPEGLAGELDRMPEVIAHGLFLEMADAIIIAGDKGTRRIYRNKPKRR
jgi:ribose 5-phosphate isomerase A